MMSHSDTENIKRLATRPVGRLLWEYSLPAVVGMLVMQLYNVVDRALIGHFGGVDGASGTDAIAGLTITFPLMNITTAVGVLVGVGASALVSILLGQKRHEDARQVLGQALTMTLIFGTAYLLFFAFFMDDALRLFGANEASLPYARTFMMYILPGLFLMNLTYTFNNIMRASGHAIRAMMTMLLGAGVNILLATLFVYVFRWGIKGAAIASDISMAITTIYVMTHFVRKDVTVHFERGTFALHRHTVSRMLGIGAAPSIVNICACLINIFINNSLTSLGGNTAVASAGVFVTFASMLVSAVIGLCQGMQPIVGYNYGAGLYSRTRRAYWLTVLVATVVMTTGWAVARWAPATVAGVILPDPAGIEYAAGVLPVAMAMFWMVGFQIVSTNFLQSLGRIGYSIILSLSRQVLFLLPLMWWLTSTRGLDGIWLSFPLADVCATLVTIVFIFIELRQLSCSRSNR